MILYINGDSHAAAAEAVNPHAFAEDDALYWSMGRRPHPDNERVSFGCELANHLNAILQCDAESASSNDRILRTTRSWIDQNESSLDDTLMIIQWSTWEREEWLHNGIYYQVNASGIDHVPMELQEKYRHYILGIDWQYKSEQAHKTIWTFHNELKEKGIKHIFFNGNNDFSNLQNRQNWNTAYLDPYNSAMTFDSIVRTNGFKTVSPKSWHFGEAAHRFFANYLLQYITVNKFI